MIKRLVQAVSMMVAVFIVSACTLEANVSTGSNGNGSNDGGSQPISPVQNIPSGETGRVVYVIDGDTVDVDFGNGNIQRVRYAGVNTPESDEPCYTEAKNANSALVNGKMVTLVKDRSDTDRYDRLLRYIYVDGVFVNASLVTEGYAEAVEYPPDTGYTAYFRDLEVTATAANVGCHPTGIFDDNSTTR